MTDQIRTLGVLAFGFVILGMALTTISVVWPSLARDLGREIPEMGVVIMLFGIGYTVSTTASGRVGARIGIARLLVGSALGLAAGLSALALAPTWPALLMAVAGLGLAGGFLDAASNTYVAIRRGARAMGALHGAYGVGAIAGPLLVTLLLQAGASWRVAFASLAVVQILGIAGLWRKAHRFDVLCAIAASAPIAGGARSRVLTLTLVVFFMYSGMSTGAGVWLFTLLTEERQFGDGTGGVVVAVYWGGLAASRLVIGVIGDRFQPDALLRWSAIGSIAGFAVFWWNPAPAVAISALAFAGFSHGPIFPVEMILTSTRFGAARTGSVVGFEIAAANIGGAVIPGAIGLVVGAAGLWVVPPIVFVMALGLWGAIEGLRRASVKGLGRGEEVPAAALGFVPGSRKRRAGDG